MTVPCRRPEREGSWRPTEAIVESISFCRGSHNRAERRRFRPRKDGGIPMGCDMLVALGPATVQGQTLFGLNHYADVRQRCRLRCWPAQNHSPDETIQTAQLELPQVRQTGAVLGLQLGGAWGLLQGCN